MTAPDCVAPDGLLSEQDIRGLSRNVRATISSDAIAADPAALNMFTHTFRSVLSACHSSGSVTYQVAAWNTLCAFIDQAAVSSTPQVRQLLWHATLWEDSVHLFVVRNQDARPKSIKQLLVSLSNALRKADSADGYQHCRSSTIERLLRTVSQVDVRWDLRACLTLLSHFLSKEILPLPELYAHIRDIEAPLTGDLQNFLEICMRTVPISDCASAAGHLIGVVLDKAGADGVTKSTWTLPLRQILRLNKSHLGMYRTYLMPSLFLRDPTGFQALLQSFELDSSNIEELWTRLSQEDQSIVISSLQVGKTLGLVVESTKPSQQHETLPFQLRVAAIRRMLYHADRDTRLAGLSLIVDGPSITRPLLPDVLDLLRHCLPAFHADTDANFRSELFAMTQRLLDRTRAAMAAIRRQQDREAFDEAHKQVFDAHESFVRWYRKFLIWELRPAANYQRHITSLKCLLILLRCGIDPAISTSALTKTSLVGSKWSFNLTIYSSDLERLLVDLLMDPYDDVRQTAASIMSLQLHTSSPPSTMQPTLYKAHQVAEKAMLASGRADQADAVAHINALLFEASPHDSMRGPMMLNLLDQITTMLGLAHTDLSTAVERYPVHGLLTSLRYILIRAPTSILTEGLFAAICHMLQEVWKVVKPTLCNDAPEGFVPEELEEQAHDVDTKNVLSYCWRALKEASLLLGLTLTLSKGANSESKTPHCAELIELTFTQLAELRHRGAFSTVAQTWVTCCQASSTRSELPALSTYIERIVQLIQRATINTRRSAGLPSLLCGILAADTTGQLLPQSFLTLSDISRQPIRPDLDDESSLPQVHALNCIKEILKNSKLATRSESLTPSSLKLAAASLQSPAWAVRNCGLMLFRAVLDRLLGSNDSYLEDSTVKNVLNLEQHPDLLEVVLDLIDDTTFAAAPGPATRYDGVFPALQLIQHAKVPEAHLDKICNSVSNLISSPSWLVRDKAARTLAAIATADRALQQVEDILEMEGCGNNSMHGICLVLRSLLRGAQSRQDVLPHTLLRVQHLSRIADSIRSRTSCPPVLAMIDEIAINTLEATQGRDSREPSKESTYTAISATEGPYSDESTSLDTRGALKGVCNSDEADHWLEHRGALLNRQAGENTSTPALTNDLADFVSLCCTISVGKSVFSTEAVARVLQDSGSLLRRLIASDQHGGHKQKLCLLVYDLLNDDDEDVRMMGAQAACTITSVARPLEAHFAQEPSFAARTMLGYMVREWSQDADFASIVLERAFDVTRASLQTFGQMLYIATQQDTTLFAEEKQNLYIDDVLEAKAWSRAATKLATNAFSKSNLVFVTTYVDSGLQALLNKLTAEADGALGWSSSAEVFVLGLRVVYATELLLDLSRRGLRLTVRPSDIRAKIVSILSSGREHDLHCLWLQELERVSSIALASNRQNVGSLLDSIVYRLDSQAS